MLRVSTNILHIRVINQLSRIALRSQVLVSRH